MEYVQQLIVNSVDTTVTVSGVTISANSNSGTFQWLDCDNGFSAISGETAATYTPAESGNYAVEVEENGCTKVSECNQVSIITAIF